MTQISPAVSSPYTILPNLLRFCSASGYIVAGAFLRPTGNGGVFLIMLIVYRKHFTSTRTKVDLVTELLNYIRKRSPVAFNYRASRDHLILGDVQNASTVNGACEVASISATDGTGMLVRLLENLHALDGEFTIATTFDLREEGLRTQIFVGIINHFTFSSFLHIFLIIEYKNQRSRGLFLVMMCIKLSSVTSMNSLSPIT